MQQAVEQHRAVAAGQNEPVAVGPLRIAGAVPEKFFPKPIADWCQTHRRAGVAGVGFLHAIHRESADGVDAKLVEWFGLRII